MPGKIYSLGHFQNPTLEQTKCSSANENSGVFIIFPKAFNILPTFKSKTNIWKNVIMTSLAVLGAMSMYDMLRYLESSLNSTLDLGTAALATFYATMIPSLLFAPTLIIHKLGLKNTLVVSLVLFIPFFAAHFYSSFYTFIPTAVVTGFGSGLVEVTANCIITELAASYASLENLELSAVINRFFGIYVMITYTGKIWGNFVSSAVLYGSGVQEELYSQKRLKTCGCEYCNEHLYESNSLNADNTSIKSDHDEIMKSANIVFGISILVTVIIIAIAVLFIDKHLLGSPQQQQSEKQMKKIEQSEKSYQKAMNAVKLWKNLDLLYLLPSPIFAGLMDSFTSSDFTRAFVTCSLGVHYVGIVIMSYGVAASLTSCVSGWLASKIKRGTLLTVAFIINIAIFLTLLHWDANPNFKSIHFIIASFQGVADAIWRSQLFALFGQMFRKDKEAGFANFEIWEAIGFVIGYSWHSLLCIRTKVYTMISILVFAFVGYVVSEQRLLRCHEKMKILISNL